jgi:hypothetical protein
LVLFQKRSTSDRGIDTLLGNIPFLGDTIAFDIGMDAQSMLLLFASVEEESCSADIEKKDGT